MHAMTKANLEAAFAGESQAHMKYLIFADQAEKDGFPNTARLFRANAYAEQVHATSHFKVLKKLSTTDNNLTVGIDGETFEIEEMYPAYMTVAEMQAESGALRSTKWAREAEKVHAEMYTDAKKSVSEGKDAPIGRMHVCSVCGWTGEGEAPDNCPLCNAKKELFASFE
ncbi:rubrerythrin family protein [candidate division KSB1 bacterium]|nr:rubrerythrin family protein [candidate division KSB1 bacterium]